MFDELDRAHGSKGCGVVRAPFGYPGGKSRSITQITGILPYRKIYVEPFGGSATILLARNPSPVEVYNDAYGGVVSFYKCLRKPELYRKLLDRLELALHSMEDFVDCKAWENVEDPVERAARWYCMVQMSFGGLGRNFGRSTGGAGMIAGKIQRKLKMFGLVHGRMKNVQIENEDWEETMRRYDSEDTVFYCDPPYVDTSAGVYKAGELSIDRHRDFLEFCLSCKGYVAISGYPNDLYDNQKWDEVYSWKSFVSITSTKNSEKNFKQVEGVRNSAEERLWVKF